MRVSPVFILALLSLFATGCSQESSTRAGEDRPPVVLAVNPAALSGAVKPFSGIIRARIESPLAFQVGGKIIRRHVDAGDSVAAGEVLFELDPADFDQALRAAEADMKAAASGVAIAQADLKRHRELYEKSFISSQTLEKMELLAREALSRQDVAKAQFARASNARNYTLLKSAAEGVLMDVSGEVGQVVAAGQAVAQLAQSAEREVEVAFPDGMDVPSRGVAVWPDGVKTTVALREAAPFVEPVGRTRRARFTLEKIPAHLVLGSVVTVKFSSHSGKAQPWLVPISALDERGEGPRLWRIREGRLEPVPVAIEKLYDTNAQVAGDLTAGDRIVAVGTHLLREGMAVREREM